MRNVRLTSQKQEITNTKIDKISEGLPELNDLIKKINLLPKDWEKFLRESRVFIETLDLKLLSEMEKQGISILPCSKYLELCPDDVLIFNEKFRRLAPKLIERMGLNLETDGLENAQFQIRVLYEQNLALRNIINIFQQFKGFNNPEQSFVLNKPLQTIGFNADTTLNLVGFRVIEILTSNKIPIERVRICPICQDIFWAKRTESPACSDPHVIAVNAGKTRNRKNLEEFQKQREKLKKLDSKFGREHPLVLRQVELVKKLHNKIQEKVKKYGNL